MIWMTGIVLLVLAVYDAKNRTIPVAPVLVLGGALFLVRLFDGEFVGNVICSCIPGILFLLLAVLSKERIGTGDGLILLALGLGFNMEQMIGILGAALVIASIFSVLLLMTKHGSRKTEIPFVPFLFLGFVVVMWQSWEFI